MCFVINKVGFRSPVQTFRFRYNADFDMQMKPQSHFFMANFEFNNRVAFLKFADHILIILSGLSSPQFVTVSFY